MQQRKLTKRVVDQAELRSDQYTIWCAELKGFGVSINPGGSRTYFVDYRNRDGKRRRLSIGRHGVVTTEQARAIALETLGGVVGGEDPLQERRTRRKSITIAELCDNYVAAAEKGLILGNGGTPKKASTLATDKGRIEQHIKPLLGRRLVIDLGRSDVVKFLRDVTAGKTARTAGPSGKLRGRVRVKGGAGTAARTTGVLGSILSYAVSEGIIEANPTHGVKKPADQKRDRRLTADEYQALGRALEADSASSWQPRMMLRALALTGCRLGEIEGLKWAELDLDAQVLKLADSKTGRSIRPLGAEAVALFRSIKAVPKHPYVFPALRLDKLPFAGLPRYYRKLFKTAGLEGVTPHTLRHSFASVGADLGFTDSTIGACLGHAGSGITSRYTHRLDSVLVAAADKIAGEVDRQMRSKR